MSTYLVTGAGGFIGSHLVRRLLADGHRVRGIDNFTTGRRSNLGGVDGLSLIEGDINDAASIAKAIEGVDYVLHEAAIPSVPRSIDDPVASHHANVSGTVSVLEAARRSGTVKRVVYAASSSAYGDAPTLPKVETMTPNPRSPYAADKLAGEYYCRVYANVFGLECVCLRYFNVFGPRQDPASLYAAVIPRFITSMLARQSPPVHGDGRQSRDFTFIDNVVDANLAACTAPGASGEVINIACGERIELLGVIREINRALGSAIKPEFLPSRAGDVRDSLADIDKARRILDYAPRVSVAQGLAQTIAWYRGESLSADAASLP